MTKVRSQYWIPIQRNLVKFIIRNFRACKKCRTTPYPDPKPGQLTKDRTEQCFPFQVIGVDYKDPIFFRSKTRKDLKAYYSRSSVGPVCTSMKTSFDFRST